jgi:hypothetical protein
MTQQEKNWLLSLTTEVKIMLLEKSYVEDFTSYVQLSKLLLDTPISEGGLPTETVNSVSKKILSFS